MYFTKGDIQWKENEIESIDLGLRVLHDRAVNTNLLADKYNRPLFFERYHVRPEGVPKWAVADTIAGRMMRFYDEAIVSAALAASITVHEVAHNWHPDIPAADWYALSGWRPNFDGKNPDPTKYELSRDGQWWYLKSATFAREYGKRNPYEDWATSWESYFVFNVPKLSNAFDCVKLPSAKQKYLETFFKVQTLKS